MADPDTGDAISGFVDALARLGGLAAAALPALRDAGAREYTWAAPAARCTADVRARVRRAIDAVERAGPGGINTTMVV